MNSFNIVGRLVATPELKISTNGIPFTRLRVCVDRPISNEKKDNGAQAEDFLDVMAYRTQAEFACQYLVKGQTIAVEGTLSARVYDAPVKTPNGAQYVGTDDKPLVKQVFTTVLQAQRVEACGRYVPREQADTTNLRKGTPEARTAAARPADVSEVGPAPQRPQRQLAGVNGHGRAPEIPFGDDDFDQN